MIKIIKKIFQKLDSISQKKNIFYIKKKLGSNIETMIDVGANVGETILEFNKNRQIPIISAINDKAIFILKLFFKYLIYFLSRLFAFVASSLNA